MDFRRFIGGPLGMLSKMNDLLRKKLGADGEQVAVGFLRKRGLRILEQNFRCRLGEIDIIAMDKKTVCFVEVKTRRTLGFGSGMEAVSRAKQQKIMKTALLYLKMHNLSECDFRFDVISILLSDPSPPHVEYLENAFDGF